MRTPSLEEYEEAVAVVSTINTRGWLVIMEKMQDINRSKILELQQESNSREKDLLLKGFLQYAGEMKAVLGEFVRRAKNSPLDEEDDERVSDADLASAEFR